MLVKTKVDELVGLLESEGKKNFSQIAFELGWSEQAVERIARILEKRGVVEVHYPLNVMEKPSIVFKQPLLGEKQVKKPKGNELTNYLVEAEQGHVHSEVSIVYSEEEKRPVYFASLPTVSPYTHAYFDVVREEVARALPAEMPRQTDAEKKGDFAKKCGAVSGRLEQDLSPGKNLHLLCGIVLHSMYGLSEIESILADDWIEEVVVNKASEPVSVYHRKYGWVKTNLCLKNENETANYASQIGRKVGRQISTLNPILDAHLLSGDRVNATFYPISTQGNTLTIRRFARNPWTIVSFITPPTRSFSIEMAAMLWQAIHYEMNVIVAGGTASGKTSTLNSLLALIPPFQRVITIEDTRELQLPSYEWNWIPMVTRAPNPEGLGEVSMLDLMVNSLRMRPDRIVLGEIRRKREAEVLFEAMHTGHSVYSTLHADTGMQVLKRLLEPPIEVPPSEVEAVHLLVVQYRDRRANVRRTLEISEIVPGMAKPELNKVFMWRARGDRFQTVKPAHRYIEQMNLHTGMTEGEVLEDQSNKATVLKWMQKQKLEHIEHVGAVMRAYYADEASVVKAAEKNEKPSKVL